MRRIMQLRQKTVSLVSTASKPDLTPFRSRKLSSHFSQKNSLGKPNSIKEKTEPQKKISHNSLKTNNGMKIKLNYQGIRAICLRPNRILSLKEKKIRPETFEDKIENCENMFQFFESKLQPEIRKENLPAQVFPEQKHQKKRIVQTPVFKKYKTYKHRILEEGNITNKEDFFLSLDFSQVWKETDCQTKSSKVLLLNTFTKRYVLLSNKDSQNVYQNLKFNKYDLNSFSTEIQQNLFLVVFYDAEDQHDRFKIKNLHDIIFWIAVPLKNENRGNAITSIYNFFNQFMDKKIEGSDYHSEMLKMKIVSYEGRLTFIKVKFKSKYQPSLKQSRN